MTKRYTNKKKDLIMLRKALIFWEVMKISI